MKPQVERTLTSYWPWVVAMLGVVLLVTNGNPDSTDYAFIGWCLGFPFVIEHQRKRNRGDDDGGQ